MTDKPKCPMTNKVNDILNFNFFDGATGKTVSVRDHHSGGPWLFWKHPDGEWVSMRVPTIDDINRLHAEFLRTMFPVKQCHHTEPNTVTIPADLIGRIEEALDMTVSGAHIPYDEISIILSELAEAKQ